MNIPPLQVKIMLESNPLKSIMFVERLAIPVFASWGIAGLADFLSASYVLFLVKRFQDLSRHILGRNILVWSLTVNALCYWCL